MNSRRVHKKDVYNSMYKKYLSFRRKTRAQINGNRLLQNTNNELYKESIRLKEEIKKGLEVNSSLKAEIKDLAKDEKQIMDDNRGLYNTLTTLHNDTVAFQTMISHLLKSFNPEITQPENRLTENRNSNGIRHIINNTKDTIQLPEINYQRYNFKDIVYIQDLSPILEENADTKQSVKPSDINRRLGHRAKLLHSDKCTENVRVNGSVIDEDTDINILCPPSSVRMENFNKEIKNVEKQSEMVETVPNVMFSTKELLCSPEGRNGDNNIAANGSILESILPNCSGSQHTTICKDENNGDISLLDINIVPPSDGETTLNEKDFQPCLFANVFPRRRVINNGCSLSLGSEEGIEELNRTNVEKEIISARESTNSIKNNVDRTNVVRVRSDSFLKSNLTISHGCTSDLELESSHQVESLLQNTCPGSQNVVENHITGIKCETLPSAFDGLTDTPSLNSSPLKNIKEEANSSEESDIEMLSEPTEEQSPKKSIIDVSSKSLHETQSDAEPLSRTPDNNSVKSPKKSIIHVSSKSLHENQSDDDSLSRTPDNNSVKSAKRSIPGKRSLEGAKKSLRPKKPLNFTESPIVKMNQKRKRKLEKAAK